MPVASDTSREEIASPVVDKQLRRSRTNRMIAGVAGGLGEHFGVDPVWFRIAFVALGFGGGSGILIYIVLWLIVPERNAGEAVAPAADGTLTGSMVVGVVLIMVGSIALLNSIAPDLGQYFWPAIFIAGGLALVIGGFGNDNG